MVPVGPIAGVTEAVTPAGGGGDDAASNADAVPGAEPARVEVWVEVEHLRDRHPVRPRDRKKRVARLHHVIDRVRGRRGWRRRRWWRCRQEHDVAGAERPVADAGVQTIDVGKRHVLRARDASKRVPRAHSVADRRLGRRGRWWRRRAGIWKVDDVAGAHRRRVDVRVQPIDVAERDVEGAGDREKRVAAAEDVVDRRRRRRRRQLDLQPREDEVRVRDERVDLHDRRHRRSAALRDVCERIAEADNDARAAIARLRLGRKARESCRSRDQHQRCKPRARNDFHAHERSSEGAI